MNTKMPGFSAEASLFRGGAHYQEDAVKFGFGEAGAVMPAIRCRTEDGISVCCSTTFCCWADPFNFRSGCFDRTDFA
jgi:hypothetical protein